MPFLGPFSPPGCDGTERFPAYHRPLVAETGASVGCHGTLSTAIDVVIPPGVSEEPHTHLNHSFMFVDTPTAIEVSLVDSAKTAKLVFRRDDDSEGTAPSPPQKMEPEPLHFVRNLQSNRSLRATRIELLQIGGADVPTLPSLFDDDPLLRWDLEGVAAGVWRRDVVPDSALKLPCGTAYVLEANIEAAAAAGVSVRVGDSVHEPLLNKYGPESGIVRPRLWVVDGPATVLTTRPSTVFVIAVASQ